MPTPDQDYRTWLRLYFYGTNPQWAIAAVATFVFSIMTILHLGLLCFKRAWFLIPLIIGCLCTSYTLSLSLFL
jgi:hypothetical protein